MAIGGYSGKGQSELGLLRCLLNAFRPGDIMIADRLMCSWVELTALQCRGVDFVVRHAVTRKLDFRLGQRLGKDDQIVCWPKRYGRTKADAGYRKNLPDSLRVRVCRIRVARPGFRDKVLVIATTLFDPIEYPKEELASLYRKRWNVELDIRTLKQTLQMDQLRCKTPDLVRKEMWIHVLAYNLIRTIIARAADEHGIEPRTISFKATLQTLKAFQPMLANMGRCSYEVRQHIYAQVIESIVVHRVGDRPNRFEPRKIKQPHRKHHDYLHVHRHEAKRQILAGLRK